MQKYMRTTALTLMSASGFLSVFLATASADETGGKFDGAYVGHQTQTSGKGCGRSGDFTANIQRGGFMWGVKPTMGRIELTKAGTFDAILGELNVKGAVTAGGMDFDTITHGCFNKWHFEKK